MAAALLLPALAAAQDRAPVKYDPTSADTRYVHNYRVPVKDVAGHTVRIYEVRRAFRHGPPAFAGVRAMEMREQGYTDTVDENGEEYARVAFLLEDGNTIQGDYRGAVQSFRWPDGTRHFDRLGAITLTGGSGRFAKIRGSIRVRLALDPGAESAQGEAEGEYWFEESSSQFRREATSTADLAAGKAVGGFHVAPLPKSERSGGDRSEKRKAIG